MNETGRTKREIVEALAKAKTNLSIEFYYEEVSK